MRIDVEAHAVGLVEFQHRDTVEDTDMGGGDTDAGAARIVASRSSASAVSEESKAVTGAQTVFRPGCG